MSDGVIVLLYMLSFPLPIFFLIAIILAQTKSWNPKQIGNEGVNTNAAVVLDNIAYPVQHMSATQNNAYRNQPPSEMYLADHPQNQTQPQPYMPNHPTMEPVIGIPVPS